VTGLLFVLFWSVLRNKTETFENFCNSFRGDGEKVRGTRMGREYYSYTPVWEGIIFFPTLCGKK
jgi:hypothetical protein